MIKKLLIIIFAVAFINIILPSSLSAAPIACLSSSIDPNCASRNLYEACGGGNYCIPQGNNNSRNCVCTIAVLFCIPENCPREYIPNTACLNEQILNPASPEAATCCENKCKDDALNSIATGTKTSAPAEIDALITMFGQTVSVKNEDRFAVFVNLAITTVLGAIAAYTLVYGIILAAYKRPNTVDAEEIARINKTLTNMILGFVLAFSFVLIMQVFANLLGLGNLASIQLTGSTPSDTQIVIN
ncbi:MAG: hypothetical protein Q9M91_05795 [Candidatus Dojkabacteria bacterium]|nr:hypothetical protein [Candidatus Dojkabacteria bacterium]MDQ7021312.1 hypothetical protein [Candidatus Dojkabacteria bacterium]